MPSEEQDEEEELTITAEEIERLMMFDMMRQNFKLDDKIGASSISAPTNNNNIPKDSSDSTDSQISREHLKEIKLSNSQAPSSTKQTNLLNFFGKAKQPMFVESASFVPPPSENEDPNQQRDMTPSVTLVMSAGMRQAHDLILKKQKESMVATESEVA